MLFLPVRYFICLFGTKSFNLCLQVGYLSLVLGGICLNFVQFFTCAFIAPFPILTLIHSSSRGRGRGDNFTCYIFADRLLFTVSHFLISPNSHYYWLG